MTKLLDFPDELFYSTKSTDFGGILNHLDANDLKNIRWTCRRLRNATEPIFLSTFFSTLAVSLDSYSLARLAQITRNPRIAKAVKTIKFMFEDTTAGTSYQDTLKQLRNGYTSELLAASFSRVANCDTFIYALQNHDDAVVCEWRSLFEAYNENFPRDSDIEEVAREWVLITLDAMFSSRIELKRLIVDDHPSTIQLPASWLPQDQLMRSHPHRILNLTTLVLRIRLSTDVRNMGLIYHSFGMLDRHTQRLFVKVQYPEDGTNIDVDECITSLKTAIAFKGGLHEVNIDIPSLDLAWLKIFAKSNRGGLKVLKVRGMQIEPEQLLDFIKCIEGVTKDNPALAVVDFGRLYFSWVTDDDSDTHWSVDFRDATPHAYGSLLLLDKIAKMRAWAELAELD